MVQKNIKKSDKTDKIGVTDYLISVNDNVDLSKIDNLSILHNSRDKYDDIWINRLYNDKLSIDKITDFKINGNFVTINNKLTFDFNKIFKVNNDILILRDKKGNLLFNKILKDNQLMDYNVVNHNNTVIQNQIATKSTKSLLSDLSDKDLDKVKQFIATLKDK